MEQSLECGDNFQFLGLELAQEPPNGATHPPRHRLHNSAVSRRIENAQAGYFGEELAEHLQPNLVVGWLVEGLSEKIN